MYYFTPDTIAQANEKIKTLDSKAGGLLCILSCLSDSIEENVSYEIDGGKLRRQLSYVFDKEPKDSFENAKPSYIIFAKKWVTTFFNTVIKNKVDLLSCAVFFLRRYGFEREYTKEEVIDLFVKSFHLTNYVESWFWNNSNLILSYNQCDVENNQTDFYQKMNYTLNFRSILFNDVIQKSASDLKAAGQIQTLYSGSGIQKCFLLSDESLDQFYVMNNSIVLPKADRGMNSKLNNIFFGAPGTGKSFKLDEEKKVLLKDGGYCERVTFHPDYSYANFVGTYKPVPEGENISYKYVPGPFMRVLVNALNDKSHNHLLLIEEINRANVAAVFGDVFQLLDRDSNGESMYPIAPSEDMKKYLKEHVNEDRSFDEIVIPSNMYIWATMNSADQGVFPMDTAFKRRWDFEYNGIDEGEDKISNHEFELGGKESKKKLAWNVLRKSINDILSEQRINEDKLLGPFFISEMALDKDGKERPITNERFIEIFKNKVIMYLFEDAAKQRRGEVFNSEKTNVNRYSDICEAFDKHGVLIFKGIESYLEKNSQSQTQNSEDTNT